MSRWSCSRAVPVLRANRTGDGPEGLCKYKPAENSLADLDLARQLLKDGNYELLELLYDSVPDVLTADTHGPSRARMQVRVSDFSAIERE